jgi:hypothetical protein
LGEAGEIKNPDHETLLVHPVADVVLTDHVEADKAVPTRPLVARLAVRRRAGKGGAARIDDNARVKIEGTPFHRATVDEGAVLGDERQAGAGGDRLQ